MQGKPRSATVTCITKQHVGKHTYLYESTSFRDELGRPRNKKVRIGKLDLETGEPIYDPEYLARKDNACNTGATSSKREDSSCNTDDVSLKDKSSCGKLTEDQKELLAKGLDSTKSYGVFHLFNELSKEVNLIETIKKSFPDLYKDIFTLACFLIESQDPCMYCGQWITEHYTMHGVSSMDSQRISILLSEMTMSERDSFYDNWNKNINNNDFVALDITSISSYSELIEGVDWGYNRDGEKLPQINLCILFGEGCQYPIFLKTYNGKIGDVSTLKTTIKEMANIVPGAKIKACMDKGFYSQANIDNMIEENVDFIISVPFTNKFAKQQIESERKDIDTYKNYIKAGNDPLRGIHKEKEWHTKRVKTKLHIHVFYNPSRYTKEKNELFDFVYELEEEAKKNPENKKFEKEFKKYLNIEKPSEENPNYVVSVREDCLDEKIKNCGWMLLISNTMSDARQALNFYRTKDIVEKCFNKLKNSLDFKRLRVHNDERMENKIFIGFICIIIISVLHQKMSSANLYETYTMKELILELKKLKITTVSGEEILQPISKTQRDIFNSLSIPLPSVG